MHYLVRVRKNGQITIPAPLRKKHGIEEGTIIEFTSQKDGILLRKVPPENQTTPNTKPESIEATKDKTPTKELKNALKEAEEGKTQPLSKLVHELGLEKDVPP